jgi:hypothetical protein
MSIERNVAPLGALLLVACVAVGCSEANAPGAAERPAAAPEKPAPAAQQAPAADEPKTVADVFPAGPQKEAVMNSCGSCHNVACAAIGQRSAERWDALREGHKDKVAGEDLTAIFAYLKTHFDASKPEPKIPPRFLEGGCTPF